MKGFLVVFDPEYGNIEILDLTSIETDTFNRFNFKPRNIKKGSNIFRTSKFPQSSIGGTIIFVSDENKLNIYEISKMHGSEFIS